MKSTMVSAPEHVLLGRDVVIHGHRIDAELPAEPPHRQCVQTGVVDHP
jgi:hypothetical protein